MQIAVFPGSFDPFTKGHEDIVNRALPLFDKIIIAIGCNSSKKSFFSIEQRLQWIKALYAGNDKVEVVTYKGLTVSFCQSVNAHFMIRGIRNTLDFQIESDIANANKQLNPAIETLFLSTLPQFAHLSSSIVRDLFLNNGDYTPYISYDLNN